MAVRKKSPSGNNQQQARSGSESLFDNLNPNSLLSNAQKVINSAVNVLEEEIAAGIIAAKRMEKKVINVDEIRDDSQNLMNRIRRDTHEALDIFLDALAALSKQVGLLTDSVSKETIAKTKSVFRESPSAVQIVEHDQPVAAGTSISLSFLLSDDELKKPQVINFQLADFTGPADQKISVKNIYINPAEFSLNPGEEKEITISIKIPKSCKAGNYNSILTVNQTPSIKVILSFTIK